MPLRVFTITTGAGDDVEFISEVLIELGAFSVSVSDRFQETQGEETIFWDPQNDGAVGSSKFNAQLWKQAEIKAWFPMGENSEEMAMKLATDFLLPCTPTFSIESSEYEEGDMNTWVHEMKKYLKAVNIGDTRIHFPWQEPRDGMYNVQLEPGSSFGVGDHATTQLCIRWLQGVLKPGMNVLDYGTGSGALAIRAALHDSSIFAVGIDSDPIAVEEAKSNAVRNKVAANTGFFLNEDEPDSTYSIVVANILAPVLISLAPHIVDRLVSGGKIALSGVLCSQAVQVASVYKKFGVSLTEGEVQAEWTILSGEKAAE